MENPHLKSVDLTHTTTVPYFAGTGTMYEGINAIFVPDELYEAYINTSGWGDIALYIYPAEYKTAGLYDDATGEQLANWVEVLYNEKISINGSSSYAPLKPMLTGLELTMDSPSTLVVPKSIKTIAKGSLISKNVSYVFNSSKIALENQAFNSGVADGSVIFNGNVNLSAGAFAGSGITQVTFNGDVFTETEAFFNCLNLTNVIFNGSVDNTERMFESCKSLVSVTFNGEVSSMNYTFQYATYVENIYFTSVTSVPELLNEDGLFAEIFTDLHIWVPNALYEEWIATNSWSKWADYIYPLSNDGAGLYNFDGVLAYTWEELIARGEVDINGETLMYVDTILHGELRIPATIKHVYNNAFKSTNLTTIIFPDTIEQIDTAAICDATKLTNLTIPFVGTSLSSNKAFGIIFGTSAYDGGYMDHNGYYLPSTLQNVTIKSTSSQTIGEYAFAGCYNLKNVVLPDGLSSIGSYAFAGCTSLDTLILPASLTTLDSYIFYDAVINTLVIEENIQAVLPDYLFAKATITNLYLPSSLVNISTSEIFMKDYVFMNDEQVFANISQVYFAGTQEQLTYIQKILPKNYDVLVANNPIILNTSYNTSSLASTEIENSRGASLALLNLNNTQTTYMASGKQEYIVDDDTPDDTILV